MNKSNVLANFIQSVNGGWWLTYPNTDRANKFYGAYRNLPKYAKKYLKDTPATHFI